MSPSLRPLLVFSLVTACTTSNTPDAGVRPVDGGFIAAGSSSSRSVTLSSSAAPASSAQSTASSAEEASSVGASSQGSTSTQASSSRAGSSSAFTTVLVANPTFNEHIRPVLAARCWQCHGTTPCFAAPMSLVTYAQTQMPGLGGVSTDERMVARVTAASNTMPAGAPLSNTEQELIRRWVNQGSVEGPDVTPPMPPEGCGGDVPDAGPPTLEFLASPGDGVTPYDIPQDSDENVYTCFGFTVPEGPDMHITRFAPTVDNAQAVHHIVLYRDQDPSATPSPSTPFGCGDNEGNLQVDWLFQYGWAPGSNGMDFPPDVGMPLKGNTRLVVQIHYHPVPGSRTTDRSGVRIYATTDLRPNEAGMAAMGPQGFMATEASPVVTAQCNFPLSYMGFSLPFPDTRVFASFPHMHNHGINIKAEHIRNNAVIQTFGRVDAWSFDAQPNIPEDVRLVSGDGIRVSCTYGSFNGQPVQFGERTEQEMCYEFLYTTPPISIGQFQIPFCPF